MVTVFHAQEILFYQLPDHAAFYSDLISLAGTVGAGEAATALVMFSPCDMLALERIVGTTRARKLLKSERKLFIFS